LITDANRRLYREIMHEAILLGDKFLVDMVLARLAKLTRPSMATDTKSKIILFPNEHMATIIAHRKSQSVWVTALLTALIPFGIFLLLMACQFVSLFSPGSCPTQSSPRNRIIRSRSRKARLSDMKRVHLTGRFLKSGGKIHFQLLGITDCGSDQPPGRVAVSFRLSPA
jgi:hypothetical protein